MGGNFKNMSICGARVRSRNGAACRQIAMANGRCYLHGGKSTGPTTLQGLERMKAAKTKHGYYSRERVAERRLFQAYLKHLKNELEKVTNG